MKFKELWEKYQHPVIMNFCFVIFIILGFIATTKTSLFIAVVDLILLWNYQYFRTIPMKEEFAYLKGQIDLLGILNSIKKQVKKKK